MRSHGSGTGDFILFRTDGTGPTVDTVVAQVSAAPDVALLRRTPSALLVRGSPEIVHRLVRSLPGWSAEPNGRVRAGA